MEIGSSGVAVPGEEQWSPAELVARIRKGESAAEAQLVARYGRGITIILRRAAGAHGAADDLYQEVFLRAVEKIRAGELRDPERLSGFICGIARNLAIDYFRRRVHGEAPAGDADVLSLPEPAPNPLERMMRDEAARAVRQMLAELPSPRDREILTRFYIQEEDKERICTDLGLSGLHFNRVLHRARERFRELFARADGRAR
jgi:RNA polymerase sigma-70 factor (ECF subfamily)